MKKLFFLIPVLFLEFPGFAQQPKTLIGQDFGSVSGFGGFMISVQPVQNNYTSLSGGGGAVIFGNRFYLGGYGLGLAEDIDISVENTDYRVDYGHGGFMLGYVIRPNDLLHFGLSSRLGWGEIEFAPRDQNNLFVNTIEDGVFVVHPQAEVELNVTSWFKFNVGLGYSKVVGVDNFYYRTDDFDGLAVGISFLFGWFR